LEIVGLEVMTKIVRAGTYLKDWRERVPDFRSSGTEDADAE